MTPRLAAGEPRSRIFPFFYQRLEEPKAHFSTVDKWLYSYFSIRTRAFDWASQGVIHLERILVRLNPSGRTYRALDAWSADPPQRAAAPDGVSPGALRRPCAARSCCTHGASVGSSRLAGCSGLPTRCHRPRAGSWADQRLRCRRSASGNRGGSMAASLRPAVSDTANDHPTLHRRWPPSHTILRIGLPPGWEGIVAVGPLFPPMAVRTLHPDSGRLAGSIVIVVRQAASLGYGCGLGSVHSP